MSYFTHKCIGHMWHIREQTTRAQIYRSNDSKSQEWPTWILDFSFRDSPFTVGEHLSPKRACRTFQKNPARASDFSEIASYRGKDNRAKRGKVQKEENSLRCFTRLVWIFQSAAEIKSRYCDRSDPSRNCNYLSTLMVVGITWTRVSTRKLTANV